MRHGSGSATSLVILLSLYALLSISIPIASLNHTKAQTPGPGDLFISGTQTFHITDSVYPVPGNVIVEQNGTLILDHGTLNETAPTSSYNITIRDNGRLIIVSGSSIIAQSSITLYVRGNGTLSIRDNSVLRVAFFDIQTTNNLLIQDSTIYTFNFLSNAANSTIRDSIIEASATSSTTLSLKSTQALTVSNSSVSARAQSAVLALNGSNIWTNNSFLGSRSEAISSGSATTSLYATSNLTVNNSVVSIHNASTIKVPLTLTVSAPQIIMQDSQLELPLKLGGSSTATLVNVTMPSTPKATSSAKITTYWWLTATANDNANLPLPGATIYAYYNYPSNMSLARSGVTDRFGRVKLKLLDTIYTSQPPIILENYAVNASFLSASSGASRSLPQPMSTNQAYTIRLPILSPSYLFLQAPSTPTEYGKIITFTGSLYPSLTATVQVGIRPQGTIPFTLQNVTTAGTGSFTFQWNATSLGNFEVQAFWNGSFPNYHGNQSSLLVITVTKITVTLTAFLSSNSVELIPFFGAVTITGTIFPVRSNVNLTAQWSLDGINWKTIGYVLTDSTGAYSIHWNAPDVGTYSIRVLGPEGAYYKASVSTTQTLTVNYISIQNAVYIIVAIIVVAAAVRYMRRGRNTGRRRPRPRTDRPRNLVLV